MPSGIRKRRASKQKVTAKKTRRATKKGHSQKVFGNKIIAENWDKNLTLRQNYKKLGLASNLQATAGGIEKNIEEPIIKKQTVQTARIVTDDDGNTHIVYEQDQQDESESDDEPKNQEAKWVSSGVKKSKSKSEIVRQLEEQVKNVGKDQRHQSEREQEWLHRLIEKHGEDYNAMQWDRKLNKFQQSAGDLKRRIRKLK